MKALQGGGGEGYVVRGSSGMGGNGVWGGNGVGG